MMNEILPRIYHWTKEHPDIGIEVSSYFLSEAGVLLDPLEPEEGLAWFKGFEPRHIVLTNRLHVRDSGRFQEALGCSIHVHKSGADELKGVGEIDGFSFGEMLPGSIEALEVDAICPDETALFIPREGGILAVADGLMRDDDSRLDFVDDDLMADSPEQVRKVKAGLRIAYQRIFEEKKFRHLFLAHGNPVIGDGREVLREFLERTE